MKILCPIDFSVASKNALAASIALARRLSAELVVVHAWYLPDEYIGGLGFPTDASDKMFDDAETILSTEVAVIKANGFTSVSSQLLVGPPVEAIIACVTEDPAFELIVIGTNGRTGLARWMVGSVAEKTVRHAPCSVLAVHATDPVPSFQTMLCPTDFAPCSQTAIDLALRLALPGGRGLSLLHVLDIPVAYAGEPSVAAFARDLDTRATAHLDQEVAAAQARTAVRIDSHLRVGSPARQVLAALEASEPPYDLVILGSHGRTGLSRYVMGSVAEKVGRHAPCPVLVARDRGMHRAPSPR